MVELRLIAFPFGFVRNQAMEGDAYLDARTPMPGGASSSTRCNITVTPVCGASAGRRPSPYRTEVVASTVEYKRLQDSASRAADWKNWGPYVSERAWGTVREVRNPEGIVGEGPPRCYALLCGSPPQLGMRSVLNPYVSLVLQLRLLVRVHFWLLLSASRLPGVYLTIPSIASMFLYMFGLVSRARDIGDWANLRVFVLPKPSFSFSGGSASLDSIVSIISNNM